MPDEKTPKGILRIDGFGRSTQSRPEASANAAASMPSPPKMRSPEELAPIAAKLAENGDLAKRFEEVRGTDRVRANMLIDEITRSAQKLDPAITDTEGIRIALLLLEMFSGTGRVSKG
jgi:hypothetical protein